MRRARVARWGAVVVLALVALVATGVGVLTNTDWGRAQVRTRALAALTEAVHGRVSLGRVSGNLLRGLTLHDLVITDSSGGPFLQAREVHAGYAVWPLISKRVDLSDVRIDSATIVLDRPPNGVWNYERIFPTDSTAATESGPGFGDWVVLRDVAVTRTRLMVRIPWRPDTTLGAADRDSSARAALAGESRTVVIRHAGGGLQQVQDFQSINARLPLVRIAHPDERTRRIEVDSLRMVALAFAPPAADVRQLSGAFELDSDSLWFDRVALTLPASRAQLRGRYGIESGDLRLSATGAPVALDDLRFLYPALPREGSARMTLLLDWTGPIQRYDVRELDLRTGTASMRGTLGLTMNSAPAGEAFRLDNTALTFARVPTALLERLVTGLDIPRTGTLSGTAIATGTADAMQVDGDITFDDQRSGRSRVLAAGELGATNGIFRAEGLRVTLSPLQVDLMQLVAPSLPVGGTLSGNAILDGRTDGRLAARALRLRHDDRSERSSVTGSAAFRFTADGLDALDVDLFARPLSLLTIGRFAPAAELRGAVSGPIRVSGPLRALAVDTRLESPQSGVIAARGTLDLASRELGYALDITTSLFDASALSGKAPRTSLSALLQTRARGIDPATMRGTFAADLLASSIDTVAVDSVQLRASTANGLLTLDTLWIRGPSTMLAAGGTFGLAESRVGTLAWRAQVDSLAAIRRYLPPSDSGVVPARPLNTAERLARARADSMREDQALRVARAAGAADPPRPVRVDTAPAIPRDSLAGALTASGRATGHLKAFDLTGLLDATRLLALGSAVTRARAEFTWRGALTDSAQLAVRVSADSLRAVGFELDSVHTTVNYRAPGGDATVAIFQNDARDYSAAATFAIFDDRREITFNQLQLRFDTTRWTSARPEGVRWGQPGVFLDSLDLRSDGGGRLFANGRVPSDGAADLQFIVNNFQLADLLGLAQSDVNGRGRVSLEARVVGSSRDPRIEGQLALADSRYRDARVPDLQSTFRYAARSLDVRALLADSARGPTRPVATATATLPIDLAFSGVTGSRLLDAPASGAVRADSLPLALISRFTDALANMGGDASGAVTLAGTLKKPSVSGGLALRNAGARVTALGIDVTDVNGAVRVLNDSLVIDSLVAWSRGRMALSGGIGIRDLAAPTVDLRFAADRAEVLDNEQGHVRADAAITARGPLDDVFVQGTAQVREGILYIPRPDNREVISAGDPAVFAVLDTGTLRSKELVSAQSPLLANLRMDLGLRVDRDTWVRSQDANVEIYSEGDLRVVVDRRRQALALDGVVNTDRGEYEFLGKRFQVKRGAVQFIGTQEINPLLQITGEYEVKQASRPALAIRIVIGGTLNSPRLTLETDAQPPISQSDLLSYLAFGSETGSLLQFGGSSLAGGTAGGGLVGTSAALATRQLTGIALGVLVNELEGQAARSLGADVFTITPANVPPELASGNFGALTTFLKGTQVEFGKYMTTRTFVGLQLQATTTPGFRVQHQVGRTPGLTLETTFQPRFFLPAPSLSQQEITKANALGVFLVRRWRF